MGPARARVEPRRESRVFVHGPADRVKRPGERADGAPSSPAAPGHAERLRARSAGCETPPMRVSRLPLRTWVVRTAAGLALLATAGCGGDDGPTAPRTGRLAGHVQDAFRAPISNATVVAWSVAAGVAVPTDSTSVLRHVTQADADGAFDFGEVTAGDWVVAAGFAGELAVAATVTVPAAAVSLTIDPGAIVTGRVQLGSLPNAGGVRVSSALPTPSVLSATDGRWVMPGLPAGRWPLRLSMDGFRDSVISAGPLAPGDTLRLGTVVLQPTP